MAQAGFRVDLKDVTRGLYLSRTVVLEEIDKKLGRGANEVAREARRGAPEAFGALRNSIRAIKLAPLRYQVAPGVDYGADRELGTDPGFMPPVESILDWIRRKSLQPRNPDLSQRDLAYLIARGIRDKGTRAQPYLEPALEAKRRRLDALVAAGRDIGVRRAWGH